MSSSEKPIDLLVIDSSCLIRRAPLKDLAQTVYAVNGVINEIRDANTRAYLQVLPFDFKLKEPTSDYVKFISNFSRKTGDYSNLSAVDLSLLSLTYQLCKENLTQEEFSRLKLEPCKNNTAVDTSKLKLDKAVNIAGFYLPSKTKPEEEKDESEVQENNDKSQDSLEESISNLNLNEKDENNNNNQEEEEEDEEEDNNNEDDENEEGWINPSNIDQVKKMNLVDSEEQEIKEMRIKVACMTADFSMQNVLIQIGIPVVSVDGLLIKKARSYVLKCITCNKITTNMSRQFCQYCGYKTLERIVVTVDSDGNKVYRGRRKPLSTKGLRFSLPMPHGGKHPNYPILSEDQPRAQNLPSKKALIKNNPLDPDYVCQSSPFAIKDVHSRASRLGIRSADNFNNRFNKRK